jgi:hypothetical protein
MSSKFTIDYWNPEASVPSNKERDNNPLEFGYFLQDLLENAEHDTTTTFRRSFVFTALSRKRFLTMRRVGASSARPMRS